jgi:crossover junction endodeoxyribonuclease RuvC
MYVTGLDLSVTAAGIAVHPLDGYGQPPPTVTVVGVKGIESMPARDAIATLDKLASDIVTLACASGRVSSGNAFPSLVVVEAPQLGTTASRGVYERGYLHFTVLRKLLALVPTVILAPPTVLKVYATGRGIATKGAMIDAVARRFPAFDTKGDDNAADASVACALAAAIQGKPLADLPETHRRAVATLTAPPKARKAARR